MDIEYSKDLAIELAKGTTLTLVANYLLSQATRQVYWGHPLPLSPFHIKYNITQEMVDRLVPVVEAFCKKYQISPLTLNGAVCNAFINWTRSH